MTKKMLLVLFLIIMNNTFINAQSRIELDFGVANTLHYKQPINLNYCDEGCFPNEQKAKLAVSINLSYYKSINQKNEIKIGIGESQYRYWEKGMASDGSPNLHPYQSIREFGYYNFFIGHRFKLKQHKIIKLYIENSIIYERLIFESYILKRGGLAIKTEVGVLTKISKKLDLNFNVFYKTGLTNYSKKDYTGIYTPFGYGIEFGVSMNL